MGQGWDRTRHPWNCSQTRICSQTRYRMRYAAWYIIDQLTSQQSPVELGPNNYTLFRKVMHYQCSSLSYILIGKHPLPGNGTLVSVSVPGKTDEGWTTAVKDLTGQEMVISIKPAPTCIIGEWSLIAEVGSKGSAKSKYHHKDTVFILFNPWCKSKFTFSATFLSFRAS